MTVWKLVPDYKFQSFYVSEAAADDLIEKEYTKQILTCSPMLPLWQPLKITENDESLQRGNFSRSWGGGFVVDADAQRILDQMPSHDFELLPLLPFRDQTLHVLNILLCADCLDHDRTTHAVDEASGEELTRILKHHFVPERIPRSLLFRLPKRVSLLTTSGHFNFELDFKTLVERKKLTGLRFEKLWSNDSVS